VFTIATTIPVAMLMGIGLRTGRVAWVGNSVWRRPDSLSQSGAGNSGKLSDARTWFRQTRMARLGGDDYGLAASILPVWLL